MKIKNSGSAFSNSNHVNYTGSGMGKPKMSAGGHGPRMGNTTGKTAGPSTAKSSASGMKAAEAIPGRAKGGRVMVKCGHKY